MKIKSILLLMFITSFVFGQSAFYRDITLKKWQQLSPGQNITMTIGSSCTIISASVAPGSGDNLGDHTATTAINGGGYALVNTSATVYTDGTKFNSGVQYCYGMSVASVTYGVSPSSITGAVFSLVAHSTYYFEFYGVFQTTATGDGMAINLTGPTVNYINYVREIMIVAGNSTDSWSTRILQAIGGDSASASVNAANADHAFKMYGIVCPSANGNLQLLRNGELSTTKLTLGKNTWGRLTRIQQ